MPLFFFYTLAPNLAGEQLIHVQQTLFFNCHLELTFLYLVDHVIDECRHLASYLHYRSWAGLPSVVNDFSAPYTQGAASRRFKDLCLTLSTSMDFFYIYKQCPPTTKPVELAPLTFNHPPHYETFAGCAFI